MGVSSGRDARGGQFMDDHESFDALVRLMPENERIAYELFQHRRLIAAFPNRKLVVYTLAKGGASDVRVLTCDELRQDRRVGCTVLAHDDDGDFEIPQVPVRYRDRELFLQVPQSFTLKWKGRRAASGAVQFVPHYALLTKARSSEHHQIDGHTYCSTFNDFRERFPGIELKY